MTVEAAARAQLQEIEHDLEAIRFRLKGVHATLPPDPSELVHLLEVEAETPASTHLRMIIETLLEDKIEPAIRDLRNVPAVPEESP